MLSKKQERAAAGYLAHGGVHGLLAALCLALFSEVHLISWTAPLVLLGLILFHLSLGLALAGGLFLYRLLYGTISLK